MSRTLSFHLALKRPWYCGALVIRPEEKHDSLVAARDEVLASRSFAAESGTLRSLRVGVRRVGRITGPARDEQCTRGGKTRGSLRDGAELLVRVSETVSAMSYITDEQPRNLPDKDRLEVEHRKRRVRGELERSVVLEDDVGDVGDVGSWVSARSLRCGNLLTGVRFSRDMEVQLGVLLELP